MGGIGRRAPLRRRAGARRSAAPTFAVLALDELGERIVALMRFGHAVEDAVDAMARKGYDGAVGLGKARGDREGPTMHDETGAGVEQDGRALALRAAYAVVEEHPQQAHPAPAAAPEWEGPYEEGAPALARFAVARSEHAASELQRCWVRRMHQEGALAEAVGRTTVIFMVARADATQGAAPATAAD